MGCPGRPASRVGRIRTGVAARGSSATNRRSFRCSFVGRASGRGPAACGGPRPGVEPARGAVLGGVACSFGISAGGSRAFGRLGTARGSVRSAAYSGPVVGAAGRAIVGRREDRGTCRSARSVLGSPPRAASRMGVARRPGARGRPASGGERAGRALERSGRGGLVGFGGGAGPARRTCEHRRRPCRRSGWCSRARAGAAAGLARGGRGCFTALDAERAQGT
jgi:hypothetical protein